MDLRDVNLMSDYTIINKHCQEKFSASYKRTYKLWVAKDFKQFFLLVQPLRLNFRNSERFSRTQNLRKQIHSAQMGIMVNSFSSTTVFKQKGRSKGSTYIFKQSRNSMLGQPSIER